MVGKTGLALVGRALLRTALIQLSADEWDCVPSLVVFWPEPIQPLGHGLLVWLLVTFKRVYIKGDLLRLLLPLPCLLS